MLVPTLSPDAPHRFWAHNFSKKNLRNYAPPHQLKQRSFDFYPPSQSTDSGVQIPPYRPPIPHPPGDQLPVRGSYPHHAGQSAGGGGSGVCLSHQPGRCLRFSSAREHAMPPLLQPQSRTHPFPWASKPSWFQRSLFGKGGFFFWEAEVLEKIFVMASLVFREVKPAWGLYVHRISIKS